MSRFAIVAGVVASSIPVAVSAAQDFDQVQIRTVPVTDGIVMLQGSGGNIAISFGEDGTFMVDDQYAPLTDKIVAAIATVTPHPVAFVINTHWHFDHTGGNENFGGAGAVIVSHENSRRRMETDQFVAQFSRQQPAYAKGGLPKVTFDESVRFHMNGQTVDVFHTGRAHTDGDAMVHFREANVIHSGDVFVRYGFPFIDQPNGGSIDGIIDAVNRLAALSNDATIFIPGHGDLSKRSDLVAYRDMLVTIRDRIQRLIAQRRTLEEIVASNPTEGFEQRGIPSADFVKTVYESLKERR